MNQHLKQLICLTDNYPDGQKICGVELVYDQNVDSNSVTLDTYCVRDRNITSVAVKENSVIISLNIRDRKAGIIAEPPPFKPGKGPGGPGGPGGPPKLPTAVREPREVHVAQLKDILAADGTVIHGSEEIMVTESAVEPIIDQFQQFEFKGLGYNLYIPKAYDGTNALPLVVFIHDAGPCGPDTKITLSQGNGAINFAKPEWQNEHPCFVLAPQIPRHVKLTNDRFEASEELYIIKAMIDDVIARYGIDRSRVYTTGQSMGCMASCEMNILFPDFFAASLLVAGQWSPERMAAKCTNCKLWILVSNHDAKAFPGMNAVTEAMEQAGAKIGRYIWDAKAAPEVLEASVSDALKDDVGIRYTVFSGSSVVPEYKDDNPATNHVCTWPVAYEIKGLKRWLFSCQKEG